MKTCDSPDCHFCKNDLPFTLPDDLYTAFKNGKAVIFAGAGISTETKGAFKTTLYSEIRDELRVRGTPTFSALMSQYCALPNGRKKLLAAVRARFDYARSFPDLLSQVTKFHREIATVPQIDQIVTTNWDDFFETESGALPFTSPEDFIFWDAPGRKVFKIHGSISNLGSIVATQSDYRKQYQAFRTKLIGSNLKMLLATKTVVFVGYSFGDEDFNHIHKLLAKEMTGLLPHSYFITIEDQPPKQLSRLPFTVIKTDATHFIRHLKNKLISDDLLLDDERFRGIYPLWLRIKAEHRHLSSRWDSARHPEDLHCLSYQDGVRHALDRIMALSHKGNYSVPCAFDHFLQTYKKWRAEKLRAGAYYDVAYIDGFIAGNAYLVMSDKVRKHFPFYYLFGSGGDIKTIGQYYRLRKYARQLHKRSYDFAVSVTKKNFQKLIPHHAAFVW